MPMKTVICNVDLCPQDISDVIAGGHRVCVQTSLQQSVNALISRDLKVMETVSVQESLRVAQPPVLMLQCTNSSVAYILASGWKTRM